MRNELIIGCACLFVLCYAGCMACVTAPTGLSVLPPKHEQPHLHVSGGELKGKELYLCGLESGDFECVPYSAFLQWKASQQKESIGADEGI